ncbi:MAG: gamma-glutamyl-gamma-aminobutyrate hydrolase family protein [Phycisphaerales bacterium]|nr:MAG: gamma-glutamyl-gamma-aminobutyrate hydrolase family protein [Phycisphaerales bacterium]
MSPAPLIGIPCELETHAEFAVKNKNALDIGYSNAILRAGGNPAMVPVSNDGARLEELFHRFDGIMFPGCDDIPPARYGRQPHPTEKVMPESQFETWSALLAMALEHRKPVLAICGGLQLINIHFGGSLIQDIPSQTDSAVCHHSHTQPDATHDIDIDSTSRLAAILGHTRVNVNSAHHQSLDRVADRLLVTARCPDDGIIEAGEIADHPFLVAVQWHPERHFEGSTSCKLFAAFVNACRQGAGT